MPFTIEALPGVNVNDYRAVVFLIDPNSRFINGKDIFDTLDERDQNHLKHSATLFVGRISNRGRHHGWNQSVNRGQYVRCYVLKAPPNKRYYGFLCHPASNNARLEVFVLVRFATKDRRETDFTILDKVIRLMENPATIKELEKFHSL